MSGIFLRGICKGVRNNERRNTQTGEVYADVYIGFDVQTPDQYGGVTVEQIEVQCAKTHIDAKLPAMYSGLKGKELIVPIWVQTWQSKDKAKYGYQLRLSGDGKPSQVSPPVAKAVG